MYAYMWEYRVRPESVREFLTHYEPGGSWTALFGRSEGYLGTVLLRDRDEPDRFVTIDKWDTEESHARFLRMWATDYEALDRRCEALTLGESSLGDFDTI